MPIEPPRTGPVRVVQLHRRPHPQQRSIERVFATVDEHLPEDVEVEVVVSSYPSTGVLPRVRAVWEARRQQGPVTHVVGDVHYLTLLMDPRRTVLTVHDTEFLDRATSLRALLYSWLWLRLPVRRSAVVTVVSAQTRDDLLAVVRCPREKVRVIPNPVRSDFTPSPRGERRGAARVLLMGTWPNKNVTRAAQALVGLGCRAVVVGTPDDEQRAALWSADPDFEEHVDLSDAAVVELLRGCDLLLFPSLKEGFGLPVVEAQAVGCPVVTSDRSPLPQVAGGAAELVDPEDVASIRAGVRRVLDDAAHREQLVAAGLANAERYRPDRVAEAYASVYREVYEASRR